MKSLKYLAIAIIAVTMAACGDDEPSSSFTREFNMIYPQLAAGHKFITKIERNYDNGASSVATASYDGDHLKSIKVVNRDKNGSLLNDETIYFDYKNGAIVCDKNIQDVTYAFEVNSMGAITRLKNVTTSQTISSLTYNESNEMELAQTISQSATATTKFKWNGGKLDEWVMNRPDDSDSVKYAYGTYPNKGGIDIPHNASLTFTVFVCAIIRNAGLMGATSSYLPVAFYRGLDIANANQETGETPLKQYPISYEFDADGYVTSYTTTESPKYTVKFTYR